jgi:hypothetical protein
VIGDLRIAWRLAKGYRLQPWKSPYLRWRIETWSGIPADSIGRGEFVRFAWKHRSDLRRYLRWAAQNARASQARSS